MSKSLAKLSRQSDKLNEFWARYPDSSVADSSQEQSQGDPPPETDAGTDSTPQTPAIERYVDFARESERNPSHILHPDDQEFLAQHLAQSQLDDVLSLLYGSGGRMPPVPQPVKGDVANAKFVVVTMRPTKPARLHKVGIDLKDDNCASALVEVERIVSESAHALLAHLGFMSDELNSRVQRLDLRDKAALLAAATGIAPFGQSTKRAQRIREEHDAIIAQLGVEEHVVDAAVAASGIHTEELAEALRNYYDSSAWRLLVQAEILDHVTRRAPWYGWLNHDRAYQSTNSLLDGVAHNAQESSLPTYPKEAFAEISLFPYQVDAQFSSIATMLPDGLIAELPSVKQALKLVKRVAKASPEKILIIRGEEEIEFLQRHVRAVVKAARKALVLTYANPSTRFTTYNNLVKLNYVELLTRGDEADKLHALIEQRADDRDEKEEDPKGHTGNEAKDE